MPTHPSGDVVARPSGQTSPLEELDAMLGRMFQSPSLLELEQTMERHPDYPLLKLKQRLTRLSPFVFRCNDASEDWEERLNGYAVNVSGSSSGDDRGGSHLGSVDTKSRLWGGHEAGRAATGAMRQTRTPGGTIHETASEDSGGPATALRPNVVVIDCEELMMLLANRNPDVPRMSAREIERAMIAEFGKESSFTYRTIQKTGLYKMWRKALKQARLDVGIDDLSDALDTGLDITSRKHGRSDRRKDYSPKQEAAIREWKKQAQNAAAEAAHRVNDRKKRR